MPEFDLRLRRYDAGGAAREIIQHQSMDLTAPLGDVATATTALSTAITGELPDVLEFAVELWDGGAWAEPANGRFIADKGSWDELDPAGIRSLTGINAVAWLLAKTGLASVTGGPRRWTDTVGLIILSLIEEAQVRGALAAVDFTFTSLLDSNGVPWNQEGRVDLEFQAGQSTWQIIQTMADQNVIEFQTVGRTLHIFNPGTGEDRSEAGAGQARLGITATSIPVEASIADLSTHVTVRGDEFAWVFPVAGAVETGYGRLESTLEAGGVKDRTTAGILAAPATSTHGGPRAQYTVTEALAAATSLPLIPGGYQLGDWVSVRRATGFEKTRVMGIQLRHDGVNAEVDITLADRLQTLEARLAKRSAGLGGALGGNGRFSGHGSGSGGTSGVYVTIAEEHHIGALVKVILDGSLEPTAEGWKYMDNYRPVKGERVFATPGPDGFIILGRAIGAEYTAPGNGEIGELAPQWATHQPDRYGDVKVIKTETDWVLLQGMVIAPGATEAGYDPITFEPTAANDGRTVMQLAGIYRPPVRIDFGGVTVDTDGTVQLDWAPSAGSVVNLGDIVFNVSVEGLDARGNAAFGVDAFGLGYGLGRYLYQAGVPMATTFQLLAGWEPSQRTRAQLGSGNTVDLGTTGAATMAGPFNEHWPVDGFRWATAAQAGELTWTTLHLVNGFTDGTPDDDPSYWGGTVEYALRADGVVIIRGACDSGLIGDNVVVGVLPEGFRPTYEWPKDNYTIRANGEIVTSAGYARFAYSLHMATH